MSKCELIEVKSNLRIIARERGKIVARREGHNIWLNLGREYLATLITYTSFSPPTGGIDARIRYMGVGIGGSQQGLLAAANGPPLGTAYPGTNTQTDTDPTVTRLERPVRLTGGTLPYPGDANVDVWIGQVQVPSEHPVATQTVFRRLFQQLEISYAPFLSVPLSEVMLFTGAASPALYNNTGVAYDTYDPVSKTVANALEMEWTIRF